MIKLLKNKKKKNNKGFTLVELIVVIAIMAILAVALVPRLTHYMDKARKANDNQVIDSISTAVKLGIVQEDIYKEASSTYGNYVDLLSKCTVTGQTHYTFLVDSSLDKLSQEIKKVVGDTFDLQSDSAKSDNNHIYIKVRSQSTYEVYLMYNETVVAADMNEAYLKANADYYIVVK